MSNRVKKYYYRHFGEFAPLSFKEIRYWYEYELSQAKMPDLLYLKNGRVMNTVIPVLSRKELQEWLQQFFMDSIN
jgi:hypothetical protein